MIDPMNLAGYPGASMQHFGSHDAQAQDIYSAWKVVFEHAKAVDADVGRRSVAETTPDVARLARSAEPSDVTFEATWPSHATSSNMSSTPGLSQEERARSAARIGAIDSACGSNDTTGSNAANTANVSNAADASAETSLTRMIVASPGSQQFTTQAGSSDAQVTPAQRFIPQPPVETKPAAECVNVFIRGTSVAVVVRDASLGDTLALRSAFDVAREITGRGAALERLVLNGRTVYRQQPAVISNASTACAVRFAC